jgi:CRISPR-associated protein Csx3
MTTALPKIQLDIEIQPEKSFDILNIQLNAESIAPIDLIGLELPANIDTHKGIVLNGRSPLWLTAYLVHQCHIFSFVAINDTRLGYVVSQSHNPAIATGSILS